MKERNPAVTVSSDVLLSSSVIVSSVEAAEIGRWLRAVERCPTVRVFVDLAQQSGVRGKGRERFAFRKGSP
jgi:hypothetical protein